MPGYVPADIRFWRHVRKSETCWLWIGAKSDRGYGRFNAEYICGKQRQMFAHRFAWERLRGPIPDGFVLDHLCGVRNCVNPDHLEMVTHNENARRSNRHLKHFDPVTIGEKTLFD